VIYARKNKRRRFSYPSTTIYCTPCDYNIVIITATCLRLAFKDEFKDHPVYIILYCTHVYNEKMKKNNNIEETVGTR